MREDGNWNDFKEAFKNETPKAIYVHPTRMNELMDVFGLKRGESGKEDYTGEDIILFYKLATPIYLMSDPRLLMGDIVYSYTEPAEVRPELLIIPN